MLKSWLFLGALLLFCSGFQTSLAETHFVEVYDLSNAVSDVSAYNEIYFGAELFGITDVSIRAIGVGGGGNFECAGSIPDGWYDFDIRLTFENKDYIISTANQTDFDVVVTESSPTEWPWPSCEGSSICSILVTSFAKGTQYRECEALDFELPVISKVELTITADSVVSETAVSWGTIKARYFGKK
jgi:hypothetical protein